MSQRFASNCWNRYYPWYLAIFDQQFSLKAIKVFYFKPCYTCTPKITAVKSLWHQKPDRGCDKKWLSTDWWTHRFMTHLSLYWLAYVPQAIDSTFKIGYWSRGEGCDVDEYASSSSGKSNNLMSAVSAYMSTIIRSGVSHSGSCSVQLQPRWTII